ncbi:MAG: bis(5'-nucleosyl)-tetraphosphatase [Planctomyces sp.]|jgi:bis(5'-nucleosidyl)-tetraphosphatase
MKQPLSCGFLIVKGDPIDSFLLMRHPKRWDLPKGHVDPGETELECALRELQEETGIDRSQIIVDPNFVFENRYLVNQKRYGGSGLVEKTLKLFLGRLITPVDIMISEHEGYEWFPWNPPHEIQEMTIDPLLQSLERHLNGR